MLTSQISRRKNELNCLVFSSSVAAIIDRWKTNDFKTPTFQMMSLIINL